jgi:hypothetical protein
VPGRFSPIPAAVPPGPPRNVAVLYREFARAINYGQPAAPDFATAVRYHQLLEQTAGVGHRYPPGRRRLG